MTSTNAVPKTIACSGTVLGPNIVSSVTSLTNFNYLTDAGPSDQQSFTVSGSDLTANIVITPDANFQISTVSGGSFSTNALTFTQSAGILGTTSIYVRLKAGLVDANYTGDVTITSTNADVKTVACSGTVGVGVAPTNYSISVSVGINGIVKENAVTLADGSNISVVSGATKTFTFTPSAGYEVATLTYNGVDVKSQITNNQYTTATVLAAGTLNVTFQKVQYSLSVKSAESGTSDLLCEYGAMPSFKFTPSAGWKIHTVFYNGIDVTSSLVNGVYKVAAITANALLNVSFVTISPNGVPELINSNVKVYTTLSEIVVEGTSEGENVDVFTINGKQIQTVQSQGLRIVLPAQRDAVYLVKTANKTFKVIL